jgi:asparagine synthase (glutamine-hydrolysing)
MCGFAGFISGRNLSQQATLEAMCKTLTHRGPDASATWQDKKAGLALGHRRLAIMDLSPNGHQPMQSASGRYVIAFNGEIYNFVALRRDLDRDWGTVGKLWRGTSDTEVALEAIDCWGLKVALDRFVGMFAFALWDRQDQKLYLVRDRLGEKPLYFGVSGSSFVFGSELKALKAFPDAKWDIDSQALSAFLKFGYVPAPSSIYRGVHKLAPGSCIVVSVSSHGSFTVEVPTHYWSLDVSRIEDQSSEMAHKDDKELVEDLHVRLLQAVRRQMVADVPLGAFLSGGIDSSAIVSLMQAQSSRPIRTFTIGFHENAYNEAPYAKEVARHLGTDHTELYIGASEAAAVIPHLPLIYDEPFADSSSIPTYLVSQLTRQHVTVSLSGDGGDELFGGYPRYQFTSDLWKRLSRLPRWSRGMASGALTWLSPRAWDDALGLAGIGQLQRQINGHRLHRLARVIDAQSMDELYLRLVSQWHEEDGIVLGHVNGNPHSSRSESLLNHMRRFDINQYLPDDLLTKVDRASMSVSLESRAPFLDHNIVEFSWALPERVLIRHGEGKWILRQLLDRYVPRTLIERPKLGFAIPVAHWLRNDLREWAGDLLDERTLHTQGYLDPAPIGRMWQEHLSGQYDRHPYLWNVLMFQAWLQSEPAAAGDMRQSSFG